jgi:glucose/arabinose dehydrogenase/type 1 glutamine amidotransferase
MLKRRRGGLALAFTFGWLVLAAPTAAAQVDTAKVLMYSGTTGYRHSGPGEAIQPAVVDLIRSRLLAAGVDADYRTCNGEGTGGGALPGCRNPVEGNPAIFTPENLAQYDAIFLWQASSRFREDTTGQRLFADAEQAAIEDFVGAGGGIAAMHAPVTMGAGQVTWPWWDAAGDSAIGALMPGHSATDINNVATVQVSDRHHPSTRGLPSSYEFGDEHYTFSSNVRGTHHVLMTLDEESYNVGSGVTRMGADHPIAWCRMYEGGRIWASSLGHFAASYLENGGDNNLLEHLVGGVEWVAGTAGRDSDCAGTVWSNFTRTVLADDLQGAIGLDIAGDGKVYWTEIGVQGIESEGRLRMYDPETGETGTLLTLPTRADHQSSNDGVLGMALDPEFDYNRRLYVYYSPRQDPGCDSCIHVGHNVVSRFTLDAAGTAVVAGSAQEILRVPKVKVGNDNRDGVPGQNTYSAHVGGGSLSFDSDGNLYLGTGDDADPFGEGQSGYAPLDQRYPERYDARNTSASTNDLRGKVLRVRPLANAAGTPGPGATYAIPDGNMFAPGTANTRPEIYAMGFRNPFTVQADPGEPGTVVVGDYGPDSGADSATRGPAGIIEWNRVTRPGFHGWPLCVGDNSEANSYARYQFPSGPAGARFDCSAAQIPNESPHNTGLASIPGPAVPADVWQKRTGGHPPRFGIPPGGPQESITGPVYDYDPDNPSETKWPAYFDGSWLILDRAQNWWREVRVADGGNSVLRVNGLFGTSQFGVPGHTYPIPVRFGPDGSLYLATWSFGCCRAQLPGSAPGRLMRIDFVGDQADTTAPVVQASVAGTRNDAGDYVGRATLTLTATDSSGVERIEYTLDGGQQWNTYEDPVAFTTPGAYAVRYRAVDRAEPPNTSAAEDVAFTVVSGAGCLPRHSDDFEGVLDTGRWSFAHPTTSARPASVSGGALQLPLGAYSVDLTRPGPIGFVGQPLPDGDFELVTKISAPGMDADNGGEGSKYAQAGLKIFQTNDDWIKLAHTRNADGSPTGSANTYFEISFENGGTRTLGARTGLAAPAVNLPTWWMRVVRDGATLAASYSLTDPETGANWVQLSPSVQIDQVMAPADGPRYVGAYGGNGAVTASFDYVRVEPDELIDAEPPETAHALEPATPDGPAGSYRSPVEVTLDAADEGACASGVARTEYRIDGGAWTAYTQPFTVSAPGAHTVEYRSSDVAGNEEPAKSVSFTIEPDTTEPDATAPVTSVQLDGAAPVATYDGPVEVTLSASDVPVEGNPFSWFGARVFSAAWDRTEVSGVEFTEHRVDGGDWVRSDNDADEDPFVTEFSVSGEGDHTVQYRSVDGAGNEEPAKSVRFTIEPDTTAPETSVQLNGAAPVASYTGAVTATFSATDPGDDASGVERTEYKIDSVASWTPYDPANPPQVSGAGVHTIQYRSVDGAGNEEAPREVSFTITTVSGGGGSTPPPDGGSTPPPGGGPVEPEEQDPFVGLSRPPETSLAQFRKRGVKIRVTCNEAMSGRAVLQITGKTRRQLKLKSTTLVSRAVRCTQPGSKSVTLKPSKKVRRALGKARGTVKVTLVVRMTAPGESPLRVTRKLSLKRR